jgi:hypothetical protein
MAREEKWVPSTGSMLSDKKFAMANQLSELVVNANKNLLQHVGTTNEPEAMIELLKAISALDAIPRFSGWGGLDSHDMDQVRVIAEEAGNA